MIQLSVKWLNDWLANHFFLWHRHVNSLQTTSYKDAPNCFFESDTNIMDLQTSNTQSELVQAMSFMSAWSFQNIVAWIVLTCIMYASCMHHMCHTVCLKSWNPVQQPNHEMKLHLSGNGPRNNVCVPARQPFWLLFYWFTAPLAIQSHSDMTVSIHPPVVLNLEYIRKTNLKCE